MNEIHFTSKTALFQNGFQNLYTCIDGKIWRSSSKHAWIQGACWNRFTLTNALTYYYIKRSQRHLFMHALWRTSSHLFKDPSCLRRLHPQNCINDKLFFWNFLRKSLEEWLSYSFWIPQMWVDRIQALTQMFVPQHYNEL